MAPRKTPAQAKRKKLFGSEARRHGSFAMINPQRAYVSSAAKKVVENERGKRRSPDLLWQTSAYDAVDDVGELGFLLNLKANLIARCEMRLQQLVVDEEGKKEWVTTNDEKCERVDAAFIGPQGGKAELKRRAAMHLMTGGETYLVGTEFGPEGILWEFLSTDEIRIDASGAVTRRRDGATQEQLSKDSYTARCWRAHSRFTDLADSEVRRVLNLCQEIVILGQMVDAIAKSRLAANILFVPEGMSFSDEDDEEASDEEGGEDIDAFTQELMDHLAAPVEDRTSAAALVPLVMRGDGDQGAQIRVIEIARGLDTWAQDLRKEAMTRLFVSLDAPPEVMSGKAGLAGLGGGNVALSIDADLLSKHIVPLGELIADFLTVAYLRPMLHIYEQVPLDQAQFFRYQFDPSPIAVRGDEGASAERLWADELVSDAANVRSAGFDVADMPKADELFQRRIWKLLKTSPSVYAKALLPLLTGFEAVDTELLQIGGGNGGGEDGVTGEGDPAVRPDVATEPEVDAPAPGFGNLAMRLVVAADAAAERAVERAAGRLISRLPKDDVNLRDRVSAVSKPRMFTVIKPAEYQTLGVTPTQLLEGSLDGFATKAAAWIRQELVDTGTDLYLADERAVAAAHELTATLMEYMTKRLFVGLPVQGNGTHVPDAVVLEALDRLVPAPVG